MRALCVGEGALRLRRIESALAVVANIAAANIDTKSARKKFACAGFKIDILRFDIMQKSIFLRFRFS